MGVPKFPKLGLLQLWDHITLCENLRLKWSLKKSCSLCQELSNGMWHATWTQGNPVDSWLLVIGSQIGNLTPDLSFGHNLCFKCPNGSCEPILDIYVSINFQWYKKFFNPLGFDPCNYSLKIWESTGTPTPQVEAPLGVWRSIPSHFPSLLGFLSMYDLISLRTHRSSRWKTKVTPSLAMNFFIKSKMETMWLSIHLFQTGIFMVKVETNGIGTFLGTLTRTRPTLPFGFAYRGWRKMKFKKSKLSTRQEGSLGKFANLLKREKLVNEI